MGLESWFGLCDDEVQLDFWELKDLVEVCDFPDMVLGVLLLNVLSPAFTSFVLGETPLEFASPLDLAGESDFADKALAACS